ncbi:hypothetical protein NEMBOFW57_005372 [Staphylotrichum longicolle]|uniref:UFSP1/2/DUB catalytic domain-containing protein n=1 Tax=Staphylotrichum longicolle TaxID=669026 RepID=A0AAD4EX73_9PEZI|nr:hypothetical protein NEMBOFW57_005372 [Staphylotrichum longicolle]
MAEDKAVECPFCSWTNEAGEYEMLLTLTTHKHIESLHAEGDSPFVVKDDNEPGTTGTAQDVDVNYVECPVDSCGEVLLLEELDYHLELHSGESGENLSDESTPTPTPESGVEVRPFTTGPSRAHREAERHRRSNHEPEKTDRQAKAISAWKRLLKMPSASSAHKILSPKRSHEEKQTSASHSSRGKRLGKAQLGKYAHEDRMPDSLVALLKKSGQVSEKGGFCGYRNIQMLSSYIIGTESKGHEYMQDALPSIFQIQDWIETAWDQGINAQGRLETGGIKGTRKYIGTPEALAMFRLLNISCDAQGIKHKEPGKSEAHLMEYVEDYFQSGVEDPTQRIRKTNLPPLYFQHLGHSLTIIGFEKLKNGSKQLLVFDPSFHDSSYIVRLVGQTFVHPMPDLALKPYRRGNRYLKAYREFELLRNMLTGLDRLVTENEAGA